MFGKCSSKVEVRLLRFLEARNVMLLIIMMSIAAIYDPFCYPDILPIIFQATLMPATVNASRAPTFQPHLTAGAMYSITGFDVARCNPNFRLSDSSLLVQFSDAISLNEFTEPISPIPEECFRFRSQGELFGLANTNTQLPGKLPFSCHHYNWETLLILILSQRHHWGDHHGEEYSQ
ncbi:hypothetical protein YC2023_084348 [Brassica napus]